MEQYPFIFSDKLPFRLQRHLAFWVFWWLFQAILYSFIYLNDTKYGYWLLLKGSMVESMVFLSMHIFLSYSLIYFVLPRYLLKQKYWQTVAWVVLLFLLTAGISTLLASTVIQSTRYWLTDHQYHKRVLAVSNIAQSLMAGLRGGITIAGISATIKLMKYWYTKERKNLQLQKENAESQLQLLKAQVHPHFLFNTMNNIYSFTQNTSAVASQLVMGLSDMLRYMLYECNQPLVSLDQELKMLQDYSILEQIRYGNQLDIHMDLPANVPDFYIAPLLLLPFVENCFKHGTSTMVDQPWISLHLSITGSTMKMELVNGKSPHTPAHAPDVPVGIGIANARKRLSLLYPGRHELLITSHEEVFVVKLRLELERKPVSPVKQSLRAKAELYA